METLKSVSANDIQDTEIFAGLSDDDYIKLAKVCKIRRYLPGEYCTKQGVTSDELQILNLGKVAVDIRIENVPFVQSFMVDTLSKGNILDFSVFLEPPTPVASAVCLERDEVIYIKSSDLELIFKDNPLIESRVMKNLVKIIGSRFRKSRTQLARFIAKVVKQEQQ